MCIYTVVEKSVGGGGDTREKATKRLKWDGHDQCISFGWGFIISQINSKDGLEHPVAIESGRFAGAHLNYTTTKKEFLAIIEAFIWCRHMLLQVNATVLTDHHNLKYWMVPRQLTPRQARWMEVLSGFRFKIIY